MRPYTKLLDIPLYDYNKSELDHFFDEALLTPECTHIATINPEFFVEASSNKEFKASLQKTTNIVDGVGIQHVLKLLYKKHISRITGVDIAEKLCDYASKKDLSVFFLGGYQVADKVAQILKEKHPPLRIAGTLDGDRDTFEEVLETNPDIILVAFGAPKQEEWIEKNKDRIPSLKIAVGVGGTFDFWAEKIKRAPKWMREIGLEWLYRLIKQPSRWKRIFNAVVVFPWLCLKDKVQSTKIKEQSTKSTD